MSGSWNALTASMKGLTPEKTTFITRTRIKLCKMARSAVCRELNFNTNHSANMEKGVCKRSLPLLLNAYCFPYKIKDGPLLISQHPLY